MKKIELMGFTLCLLSMCMISCTNDDDINVNNKQITMTADDFILDSNTRTSINIGENGGGFTWAENDTVGIFPNEGAQAYFPMINGAGTNTATFTGGGWALKHSSTYAAYYPYNFFNRTANKIAVNYEGQTQTGNASTAHLGEYDYMAATATTPVEGGVNFNFSHLGCLVELNINVPEKGNLTSVTLSSDNRIFLTKGFIDLTSKAPYIESTLMSNSITVNLEGINTSANNENVKVYLMLPPFKYSGHNIKADIMVNGAKYPGTIKLKDMNAGIAYRCYTDINKCYEFNVTTPGTLPKMVGETNKYKIKKMKVTGSINRTDIWFIRDMAGRRGDDKTSEGQLDYLDLGDANIVGGESILNYDVKDKTISSRMFENCIFSTIILPKSTVSIEYGAFGNCKNLISIDIPSEVQNIVSGMFRGCVKLVSFNGKFSSKDHKFLIKPNGDLMAYAAGNKEEDLSIPDNVKRIWPADFSDNENLKSVTIPNSVTYISGFWSCTNLQKVILSENLDSIESQCFAGCTKLSDITIPNSVKYIGDLAFDNCESVTKISIPAGVKTLKDTFSGCKKLSSVEISEGVEYLIARVFSGCESLTTVHIPSTVQRLGGWANFAFCTNLMSFTGNFSACNNKCLIDQKGCLVDYANGCQDGSFVIPDYVKSIGCFAFAGSKIRSLVIPKSVTLIDEIGLGGLSLKEITCYATTPPVHYSGLFHWLQDPSQITVYVPKESIEAYKNDYEWGRTNIQPIENQ